MSGSILQIKLDYSTPIELVDLNNLFSGLLKQYNKYVNDADLQQLENITQSKLCIQKVDNGSAIFDLVPVGIIVPLLFEGMKRADLMLGFAEKLDKLMKAFSQRTLSQELAKSDCIEAKQITELTAKDPQGSLSGVVQKGDGNTINIFNIGFQDANLIQNQAQKFEAKLKQTLEHNHTNVLLRLHQVKDENHPSSGEKGIIETISSKPTRLRFSSASDHDEVIKDPFGKVFLVDVRVETIDREPKLYIVQNVNESFGKDEI